MSVTLIASIAAALLGVVALVLFFLAGFRRYRVGLLLGAMVLFAIAIGVYMSRSEALIANTPTPTEGQPSPAPISPVSPVGTPQPGLAEVSVSEAGLEGCLLFVSDRSGDFEIYRLQESSANLQQLTSSPGLDIDPAWSPDGQQVAFASGREEETGFQIYIMNADGSGQTRLSDGQLGDNGHPRWSPDGSQVVFQSKPDASSAGANFDIYVMNSDGSGVRAVTTDPADDTEPSWSPDGRQIAFLSERSGQDEIYVMDSDGSNVEQLTEALVLKSGLSWSDDGQRMLFEGSGDIYVVGVETKELSILISDAASNEATPGWAQSGKSVVFSSDRSQNWELYMLSLDEPGSRTLYRVTDDPGVDRSPAWSACSQ